MGQAGGPVKSDEGCLSPGHVYQLYTTFAPGPGLKGKRRTRSQPGVPRMRVHPVPPEPEVGAATTQGDDDEFGTLAPTDCCSGLQSVMSFSCLGNRYSLPSPAVWQRW